MPENAARDDGMEDDRRRSVDPRHRSFVPPEHPSLRDPETNPRGVRHIDQTAQDLMPVEERPRYQAAQARRAAMIAAGRRRLRGIVRRGESAHRGDPRDPQA